MKSSHACSAEAGREANLWVNRIQTFALHDGPGIRSTVFLQGCNLRCAWCHNPETWPREGGVLYNAEKCLHCGACVPACVRGAHALEMGHHSFDPALCVGDYRCLARCPSKALDANGVRMTTGEVLQALLRDRGLYERSGGGVTFSGGEPLLQADALLPLLRDLRQEGVHTALDSALCVPWQALESVLPWLDLVIADFKLFDPELHRAHTGAVNTTLRHNLQGLAGRLPYSIRVPVIAGVNDSLENMEATARFLSSLKALPQRVELLAYHDFGVGKAALLGRRQERFAAPSGPALERLAEAFRAEGIEAQVT